MSTQENVQIVKDFFAAMRSGDMQALLALSAEDIEWIIPGEGWPLAGTHRGHAGLADLLQKASETLETSYPKPFEFVAQGDRVLVVGFAGGKIIATNKTFEDDWVFAITVQNGRLTNIRKYIDSAQPRADLGGGPEGHRHPGKRAVARGDGDRTREGSARRGGPEGLRLDDSAPAHGRSGGDRSGGFLSRVAGQQLHDCQRGRRRRRPSATLTRYARPGAPFDYSERRRAW
jgi:uncharacterized protein